MIPFNVFEEMRKLEEMIDEKDRILRQGCRRIEELEEKVKISAVYIMISLPYILYTIIK